MHDLKSIKTRALNIGLPFRVWAKLASEPGSIVHQPQISNWFDGIAPSADKQKRLIAVLESVEDLCASTVAKISLTDADNVRTALAKLAEIRANPATAPWSFRGAVAAPDDSVGAVSSATEILAGAE